MFNKLNDTRHFLGLGIVLMIILGVYLVYILPGFNSGGRVLGQLTSLLCVLVVSTVFIYKIMKQAIKTLNHFFDTISIEVLIGGTLGLFVGVVVGVLSGVPLATIGEIGTFLTVAVFVLSGYIGASIGSRRAGEVLQFLPSPTTAVKKWHSYKVLDTSAIIDGRIFDVCLSKFLEGPLIVPNIVIEELQHIADSSDNVRRNKGRRGLDLLNKMQKHADIKIDIIDVENNEDKDVDARLVQLCKQLNANIVTNDYNLNKVAELQGIKVLNINELANAVKMIVYPGETLTINVIKEGKEPKQGVGYLEDGTMVVVESADHEIGKELEVMVTSVFQTAAGRMIFSRKIREEAEPLSRSLQEVHEVNLYG